MHGWSTSCVASSQDAMTVKFMSTLTLTLKFGELTRYKCNGSKFFKSWRGRAARYGELKRELHGGKSVPGPVMARGEFGELKRFTCIVS